MNVICQEKNKTIHVPFFSGIYEIIVLLMGPKKSQMIRGGVIIKKRENFSTISELGLTPPPLSNISDFFEF